MTFIKNFEDKVIAQFGFEHPVTVFVFHLTSIFH